jgi:hypothetical protein
MRSLDLAGKRFGLLTPLEIVSADRRGALWLCECRCGRQALRRAAALRYGVKRGRVPQCSVCLKELNNGRFIDYRNQLKIRLLELWKAHGVLWTESDFIRLTREIRAMLSKVEIEVSEPDPSNVPDPDLPILLYDNEGICSRSQFGSFEAETSLNAMRSRPLLR